MVDSNVSTDWNSFYLMSTMNHNKVKAFKGIHMFPLHLYHSRITLEEP